jgi:Tol biopolymer transport system component
MALGPGVALGHYEVVSSLGAGGMGEVWRARDTRLGREVALKVLPPAFALDPERMSRFGREARVLASLNHPHIGAIYGLEEADGVKALVLELIEGETLADRIARGPIPLDEALPIARQIAAALEAAHEQGIVHRDLKPANVKVKPDGTVKVLDFGLAKALQPQVGSAQGEPTHSPTITAPTQKGVILGTAAYMAPEQARGAPVDRRADVWAFGCVLFEMLAGKRPFVGADVTDILAAVLRSEPVWESLPASTPPSILKLLRRCLQKTPANRLRDIGDARLEIEDAIAGLSVTTEVRPFATTPVQSGGRLRAPVLFAGAVAALALGLLFGFLLWGRGNRPSQIASTAAVPARPATRTEVRLPESAPLALGTLYPLIGFEGQALALSPDGRHLVYVGVADAGTVLYHRDLTQTASPRPIPGTDGAYYAFFSPTSGELGFLTEDRVKKTTLEGGAATTLCRARAPVIASWIDETIYFSDRQGQILASVPATGGESTALFDNTERVGGFGLVTSVLPDGRAALVSRWSQESISSDFAEIRVISLDGRDDETLPVSGYAARYVPTGHLLFARGGKLLAAPFDVARRQLTGEARPVLDGITVESVFGNVQVAFAANGMVAFVPGGDLAAGRLAWVDRGGRGDFLGVAERVYGPFDVAPDDRRFAIQVADVRDYVSIWDAGVGGAGRDLASPASVGWPLWSPDGNALALSTWSPDRAASELLIQDLKSGATEKLLDDVYAHSWVEPGWVGVYRRRPSQVGVMNLAKREDDRWVRADPTGGSLGVSGAALSPDAAWIAYWSLEGTGKYQVWIERVDGADRRQVSTDGGLETLWCRKCGELFYRQGNRVLASRIDLEPGIVVGDPVQVFAAPDFVDSRGVSYRVSSDGQRLYYVRRTEPPVRDRIQIIHNWFDELEHLVPTPRRDEQEH